MSRISRYQDSMGRFIKNRSYINEIEDEEVKNIITKLSDNSNHVMSIIVLTIINSLAKKQMININGYPIAAGVEYMLYIMDIIENKTYYEKTYKKQNINEIINRGCGILNNTIATNIENLENNDHFKMINKKLLNNRLRTLNNKIYKLTCEPVVEIETNIEKSDIIKYKFADEISIRNKLKGLHKIKNCNQLVLERYGMLCSNAIVLAWLLGCSKDTQTNTIEKLEKIGQYIAYMIKIIRDFTSLQQDIDNASTYSYNIVINEGFQNSFESFMDNKQKFIEGCIQMGIYTNTIKEIIDLMESQLDNIIDKSSPDMISAYTL